MSPRTRRTPPTATPGAPSRTGWPATRTRRCSIQHPAPSTQARCVFSGTSSPTPPPSRSASASMSRSLPRALGSRQRPGTARAADSRREALSATAIACARSPLAASPPPRSRQWMASPSQIAIKPLATPARPRQSRSPSPRPPRTSPVGGRTLPATPPPEPPANPSCGTRGTLVVYDTRPVGTPRTIALGTWNKFTTANRYETNKGYVFIPDSYTVSSSYVWWSAGWVGEAAAYQEIGFLSAATESVSASLTLTTQGTSGSSLIGESASASTVAVSRSLTTH